MSFKYSFLLLSATLALPVHLHAQEARRDTLHISLQQEVLQTIGDSTDLVVAGSGTNNWFISGSVGINSIYAEANRKYDNPLQRSRFVGRLSVGKWLTPLWGIRFRMGVGQLSGHYLPIQFYNFYEPAADHHQMPEEMKPYLSEKDGQTWFHRKFTYMDFSVDFMTDMVHWFTREEKPYGFILFAGPGFSHAFASQGLSANNSFAFKAGLQFNHRLSRHWDFIAELQGTIVDETFDGQIGGTPGKRNRTVEGYSSLTVGLSYKFGGKKFARYAKVHPVTYERIRYILPPKVQETAATEAEDIITAFTVRFFIDQYNIEEDQKLNIQRIARYLQRHPDAKLQLTGYADKETAYPSYNLKLSRRRVNTVRDYLVKECHIDPDRLIIDAKGDMERVYNQDYRWNRAVVMQVIENQSENK